MKTCYETTDSGTIIKLEQRGVDSFRVTYGLQVRDHLNYAQAASELGSCIMHALACEGRLDNRDRQEAAREREYEAYYDKCELANKIPLDYDKWLAQNA